MRISIIILALITLTSCQKNKQCPPLPNAKVNITLYTAIPAQNPNNKGYVECRGKQTGYGGVVVVSSYTLGTYRAFELSAPHLPRSKKTILEIQEDGMRAVCPADGAEFMLANGMPLSTGQNVSPCSMIEYIVVSVPNEGVIMIKN